MIKLADRLRHRAGHVVDRQKILTIVAETQGVTYIPCLQFKEIQYCIDGNKGEISLYSNSPVRMTTLVAPGFWADGGWEDSFLSSHREACRKQQARTPRLPRTIFRH